MVPAFLLVSAIIDRAGFSSLVKTHMPLGYDAAFNAVEERATVYIEGGPFKGKSGKALKVSPDTSSPYFDWVAVDLGEEVVSVSSKYLSR